MRRFESFNNIQYHYFPHTTHRIRPRTSPLATFIFGIFFGLAIPFLICNDTPSTVSVSSKNEFSSSSNDLFNEVKVLCWIMTTPENYPTKAVHVAKTWGSRCNKFLIMSSENDKNEQVVPLPVSEGRSNLWAKTKEAFKYVYANHLDDADWFLKADDDTYIIMENLRYFLYQYPPEFPVYFGHRLKVLPDSGRLDQGYMSGGAGYVLSKEALKRFVEKTVLNKTESNKAEDLEVGKCLAEVGVLAGDTRDELKRQRFLTFDIKDHLFQTIRDDWFGKMSYYLPSSGFNCCAESTISFHYQSPFDMYALEFLLYQLKMYGMNNGMELPKKMSLQEAEKKLSSQDPQWNGILPETTATKLVPLSDFQWTVA